MEHRIFGIESEFGLSYVPHGMGRLSIEESAAALFKPVLDQWRSTNVFLPNGGRLYLDVGSHPEYASAECSSIDELLAQERAGELLFADLARTARKRLLAGSEGRPLDGELYLFKNNVDSAGNSYGSHENYLISRKLQFNDLIKQLVPFLVTRQILVGAGKTHPQGGPVPGSTDPASSTGVPSYSFSQRADHIWEAASTSTSRARPLINTRDEPHADASKFRRMHVINGDSNMAEPTVLLKIASTDLVLRMLEDRFPVTSLDIVSVPAALRAISHDLTGTATFQTTDGQYYTALSVQRHYLDAARQYVQQYGAHHRHVDYALNLWQRTWTPSNPATTAASTPKSTGPSRRSCWMRTSPAPARPASPPTTAAPASASWIWRTTTSTRTVASSTPWFAAVRSSASCPRAPRRPRRLSRRQPAPPSVRASLTRRLRRGSSSPSIGCI